MLFGKDRITLLLPKKWKNLRFTWKTKEQIPNPSNMHINVNIKIIYPWRQASHMHINVNISNKNLWRQASYMHINVNISNKYLWRPASNMHNYTVNVNISNKHIWRLASIMHNLHIHVNENISNEYLDQLVIRAENSLIRFPSESLIFCPKMCEWAICSKKWAIHSFTHFWWVTWAICSQSLIFSEGPEWIAHGRSFLVRDLSDFAHITHFWWATWTIHLHRSPKKRKWAIRQFFQYNFF